MGYDEEESDNIEVSQTKIHVLKVWKQDQVKERPASVQVDLLRTDREWNNNSCGQSDPEKGKSVVLYLGKPFVTGELECGGNRSTVRLYREYQPRGKHRCADKH